jgi:hypothetical protein
MRRTTVGAEQAQFDAAYAVAAALQRGLQPARQPYGDGEHVLFAANRLGKTLLGDIGCDRQARCQRFMVVAKSMIELAQHVRSESRGQWRAWQIDDIADAL